MRIVVAIIVAVASTVANAQALPRLNARVDEWTVSGLSSGAYMASQIAVAHSARVRGVGVFAGGPYYCVGIDPNRAEGECMQGAPDPADSRREATRLAALRLIDSTDNLAKMRSWVMAGAADTVVAEPVVHATSRFFASFNAAGAAYVLQPGLGHGLPTRDFGGTCSLSAPPYLNKCGVPAAEQMLSHVLPTAGAGGGTKGELVAFDQSEFVPLLRRMWNTTSLDDKGYAWVPAQCRSATRCRVHVALHGCRQGVALVKDAFARHAGYNVWAADHDLVVLYPQVKPSEPTWFTWWVPYNPRGCWDWWGYSGTDYATRGGAQIAAISAMVARLGERP